MKMLDIGLLPYCLPTPIEAELDFIHIVISFTAFRNLIRAVSGMVYADSFVVQESLSHRIGILELSPLEKAVLAMIPGVR
jgi:hypothetical protein